MHLLLQFYCTINNDCETRSFRPTVFFICFLSLSFVTEPRPEAKREETSNDFIIQSEIQWICDQWLSYLGFPIHLRNKISGSFFLAAAKNIIIHHFNDANGNIWKEAHRKCVRLRKLTSIQIKMHNCWWLPTVHENDDTEGFLSFEMHNVRSCEFWTGEFYLKNKSQHLHMNLTPFHW